MNDVKESRRLLAIFLSLVGLIIGLVVVFSLIQARFSGTGPLCRLVSCICVEEKKLLVSKGEMGEVVKPAERDKHRWGLARCNDGTPFSFLVQLSTSGRSNKWVIFLMGGGFCDDNAIKCAERSRSLTSSLAFDDRKFIPMKRSGIFSRDPIKNPSFYDANQVFAHYCSSDVWSGNTTERRPTTGSPGGWYFSGRVNVRSMIEVLIEEYGLNDNDPGLRVLFAGSSAGGAGVLVNADTLTDLLPKTAQAGRLKLLNDGGMVPDFDDPEYRPGKANSPFRDVLKIDYDFWGSALNTKCEEAQKKTNKQPAECFYAPVVIPFIVNPEPEGLGVPLMVQYSSIDRWALKQHGIDWKTDKDGLEKWRVSSLQLLEKLSGVWLFSGGEEVYHTLILKDEAWDIGPQGSTFREVLTRFWEGGPLERVVFGNP